MIILRQTRRIIGRGGHWDKIANDAIDRKQRIKNSDTLITECGLGASGFPHIGSFADAARAYAVKIAVEDTGTYPSRFYAYSDDLDGLRKVPVGLPTDLEDYIGVPVSNIPDLEDCHQSYGSHMVSLLLESLDQANIDYIHKSAAVLYGQGKFTSQISQILNNHQVVGQIIEDETGQHKYLEQDPYHPICQECGKIYTTVVTDADVSNTSVSYRCGDAEIGNRSIAGCGSSGDVNYSKAEGKLSWKVEFAARWSALNVDFEPYGKDIDESVRTNNRISQEILSYEAPSQVRYEMFLDKGGTKISKSKGNVFTPQHWFEYGSPQSLVLMTLKRIEGARALSIDDIPSYMDELHDLEALYYGYLKDKNETVAQQKRTLYEYAWWLQPPPSPHVIAANNRYVPISYTLISHLAQFTPDNISPRDFIRLQLEDYELINSQDDWSMIASWVEYAISWSAREEQDKVELALDQPVRQLLGDLLAQFDDMTMEFDADQIQQQIFNMSNKHEIKPGKIFPILYTIYLGITHGPRIGKIIALMGRDAAIAKLARYLNSS